MEASIANRKGPRKVEDVSGEVLTLLNKGEIETVNLTEWLAIDHVELAKNCFSAFGLPTKTIDSVTEAILAQKKPTAMNSTKAVGSALHDFYPTSETYDKLFDSLSTHTSDSVRCYSAYVVGLDESLKIEDKLNKVKPLVADHHFGVREVVWMAVRPSIEESLEKSIAFLSKWTESDDENVRRFTTESTRPRGVWCKYIQALTESPEQALPILEKLKADPSKYVQDSVGNWLNDASKSRPDFVLDICERWEQESPTSETKKIIKKAKRTLEKG